MLLRTEIAAVCTAGVEQQIDKSCVNMVSLSDLK
mgnify:CR=1 FL=1